MLQNLPDLAAPVAVAAGAVYAAFDRPGVGVVVPDRLGLERLGDGGPALLVSRTRGRDGALTTGGRLELGVAVGADLDGVGRATAALGAPLRLAPAEVLGGTLEARGLDGVVVTAELGPDLLSRARMGFALSEQGAVLAAHLVTDGVLPVAVTLRLALRAVAPRVPLVVTFDPQRVAARLAERFADRAFGLDDLTAAFDGLLGGPDLVVLTGDRDAGLRADTLALRLQDRFTVPDPAPTLRHRLRPAAGVPGGQVRVDLAEPVGVVVHRLLTLDAVAVGRELATWDGPLVRDVDLPALPAGHVRVTVAANLLAPIAGLLTLIADVDVPARPPQRPQGVTASVPLAPGDVGEVTLALAPGERPEGRVRLRALLDAPAGPVERPGDWQPLTTDHALLGPAAFPLPLTAVRASAALTELAEVEIRAGDGTVPARLDAAHPVVVVPRDPDREPLRVVLRPSGPGRVLELPLDVRASVDLDPTTLPGFGAHRARLSGGARPTVVEWRAEGADERLRRQVRLGPDRPTTGIGWVATSPFQPGVQWRVSGAAGPASWSRPELPEEDAVIVVDEVPPDGAADTVEVDGVTLAAERAEPGVWTYVPPGPLLDRNGDGTPAVGLIEAGPVAFLQLTARLDLHEDARTALLVALRAQRPDATAVRATRVVVQTITLETPAADGTWAPVAQSTGSGTAPWTAAMSAALTPGQVTPVKAALGGTPGQLRLRAGFTVPAPPTVTHTAVASGELTITEGDERVELRARAGSTGGSAATARTVVQIADVADLLVPS